MIGRKKEIEELNRIYHSNRVQLVAVYALGISGVSATYSAWSKREDDAEGTQVDLIIERKDNVVNMCEIKFYGNDFSVNKDYHKTLINRQELLSKELSPKVIIHNTLITTYGLKYNEYSSDFDSVITLDDLFNNS